MLVVKEMTIPAFGAQGRGASRLRVVFPMMIAIDF